MVHRYLYIVDGKMVDAFSLDDFDEFMKVVKLIHKHQKQDDGDRS